MVTVRQERSVIFRHLWLLLWREKEEFSWVIIFLQLSIFPEIDHLLVYYAFCGCMLPSFLFGVGIWRYTRVVNRARSTTASANRLQIVNKASDLEYSDISNCAFLDQSTIFHGKNALSRLEYANISGNCEKITILAVACLCSYENVQTIVAHGYRFSADELLCLCRVNFACVQTWI